MVGNIAGIIVTIGAIAVLLYLLETYVPAIPRIWKALIVAAIALTVIRTLRMWICSWVCGG
jgi:uncharacterized protein with PQ loop repeat